MTAPGNQLDLKKLSLLVLVAFLWGSAFFQIKIAVTSLSPEMVAFGRVAFALAAVFAYCAVRKCLPTNWRQTIIQSAPLGIFSMALPFYFQNSAEQDIASTDMAVVMATVPLLTVMISALFGQAVRPLGPILVGIAVGFFGIWLLLVGPTLSVNADLGIYHLFAFAAACSYALNFVLAKRVRSISLEEMTLGAMIWAVFLMGVLVAVTEQSFGGSPSLEVWAALVGLGLGSTAAASYITFYLVRAIGPQSVSLAVYLVPVFGLLLGNVILREQVTLSDMLATALILAGIWLTTALRKVWPAVTRSHAKVGGAGAMGS